MTDVVTRDLDYLVVNRYTGKHDTVPASTIVDVRAFGAAVDGTTDDTIPFLAAIAAANLTGGRVRIPAGTLRYRTGVTCNTSDGTTRTAVCIEGEGDDVTELLFDPLVVTDDAIKFALPNGDGYIGGGVSSLRLRCQTDSHQGVGIRLTGTYRSIVRDVTVTHFGTSGSGGRGIEVEDAQSGVLFSSQHVVLDNVHCQDCDIGLDINGAQEMVAYHLCLNQSGTAAGIMHGGTFAWFGGLVQGQPWKLHASDINAIFFRQWGVFYEVGGVSPCVIADTTAGGYAGHIKIAEATVNQSTTGVDFILVDNYDVVLDRVAAGDKVITATTCTLTCFGMSADPARYTLDAVTRGLSLFLSPGNVAIGTPNADSPGSGGGSLTCGAPIQIASYTTVARNLLVPRLGWVVFNTTTNTLQTWNGAAWV